MNFSEIYLHTNINLYPWEFICRQLEIIKTNCEDKNQKECEKIISLIWGFESFSEMQNHFNKEIRKITIKKSKNF